MGDTATETATDPSEPEVEEEASDKVVQETEAKIAANEKTEETDAKVAATEKGRNCKGRPKPKQPENEDTRKMTYRDFSHVKPPPGSTFPKRNPANKEATFPMKLHAIVSSPEFWEVSWLPHGRSWRINNAKSFEERVIPIFFRHGRYTSFARQVNGWGFRRISHGGDYSSYYHELFLRGMPHLVERMKRLTNKDIGIRKKTEQEKTPDLEAIGKDHPLPDDMPLLPLAAVAAHRPPSHGMENYFSSLSDNSGGVDTYLSSLSDAEVAFLARRQMFRQSDPFLMGDPSSSWHRPVMHGAATGMDGMQDNMNMGPHPGISMQGDPRVASARMPMTGMDVIGGSLGRGHADMALMQGFPRAASTNPAGNPRHGLSGPRDHPGALNPLRNPMGAGYPPTAHRPLVAGRGGAAAGAAHHPPPGNPSLDQFLYQATDNELAQLIAMHDAAAARQSQQMPPY